MSVPVLILLYFFIWTSNSLMRLPHNLMLLTIDIYVFLSSSVSTFCLTSFIFSKHHKTTAEHKKKKHHKTTTFISVFKSICLPRAKLSSNYSPLNGLCLSLFTSSTVWLENLDTVKGWNVKPWRLSNWKY